MEENRVSYDWEAYYKAAYEKEKEKNNLLAGKIADTQAKEEDLKFNLERIENSIFWKMSSPARKFYRAFFSKNKSGKISPIKITGAIQTKGYVLEYQQEVFRQKHPYLQWIAENERPRKIKEINPKYVINGWKKIEVENSDFCIVVCGYGVLNENYAEIIKSWFNANKNCLFAYADEDYYWKDLSCRMHPRFKPCWSPDTMLSFCYVGHMLIVRKSLYHGLLEGDRYNSGSYADFYDLCLMLEERAFTLEECDKLAQTLQTEAKVIHDRVGNIEHVLFHNCFDPDTAGSRALEEAKQSGADVLEIAERLLQKKLEDGYDMIGCEEAYKAVREAAIKRRGLKARLELGADSDIYHLRYDIADLRRGASAKPELGVVSVIIPSKDNPALLEKCLFSFRERTEYKFYEWIVVDNGSSPENKLKIEALQEEYDFKYIYEPMDFNFSAMCNIGVKNATGEYLLLLNDDIEIIQKDWLGIMLGQAAQPHVGAVGAKLWYAGSDTIQHTGITNMGVGPSHKLTTLIDDRCYYYGRNRLTYDVIGVTAACLLVSKKKYQEVGGMDESIKVAYNDVDLCFRLNDAGYYNVLRNDAVLYHYESISRGLDSEVYGKWQRLLVEKEVLYSKHPDMRGKDAFYNSNLNDDSINYTCNFKYDYMRRDKLSELVTEDKDKLSRAKSDMLHLEVDEVKEQIKQNMGEADIIEITGWSCIFGEDNAKYARSILFQRNSGAVYKAELLTQYREDVEKALTDEVNALLSGFVIRIAKSEFNPGRFKIGMLAEDIEKHRKYVTWSDKRLFIEKEK